jgi:hypothetical protein
MRLQYYTLAEAGSRTYCAVNVLKNLGGAGEDNIITHFVFRRDIKGSGSSKGRVLQGYARVLCAFMCPPTVHRPCRVPFCV